MEIDNKNLGQRLRSLRESRKVTQQELELSIDAAFGHISRIESGHLNPTKETLLKISKHLCLNEKETNYLIGLDLERVTKEEINKAIIHTKNYLSNSPYPSFLMDDFLFVYTWNKKLLDLLDVPEAFAFLFKGKNIVDVMFNERFRRLMNKERWGKLVIDNLVFFMQTVHYSVFPENKVTLQIIDSSKQYSGFNELWKKARENYNNSVTPGENLIYFTKGKKELIYYISNVEIIDNPRFLITEYIRAVNE